MVVPDTPKTAQSYHDRLPTAVKRKTGDVDVKQLVRFYHGSVQFDLKSSLRFPQKHLLLPVLGIMAEESARTKTEGYFVSQYGG
jgi:hypothetical protein